MYKLVKIEGVGYILLSIAKCKSGNITRNYAVQSFPELSYSMHYVEHRFDIVLGKSCSFCLPRVPFVYCRQFMYLVISLLVLRAGYGI